MANPSNMHSDSNERADPPMLNVEGLVGVILRLVAINFLMRVIVEFTPRILHFLMLTTRPVPLEPNSVAAIPWVVLAAMVGLAALIWFLSVPIARFVTKGVPKQLALGGMTVVDCYSIVFIGVGLFYIVSHLPYALTWIHYLFKLAVSHFGDAWKEQVRWYEIANAFIPFIFGVALFVNGRRWAVVLSEKHSIVKNRT